MMSKQLLAVIAVFAFHGSLHAKTVLTDGNFIAMDSDASGDGFVVPSTALDLLVGSTNDGVLVTDAPATGNYYAVSINSGNGPRFTFFPYSSSGGTQIRINPDGYISINRRRRSGCDLEPINTDLAQVSTCMAKRLFPFWDDLEAVSGETTITRGSTVGTSDDYWYVQWNDIALASNTDARLSFRVTYFAQRQTVRFNYIKLIGAGSAGESATIGITQCPRRNRDQIRTVMRYSFNSAVLPTGTATAGSSLFAIEFSAVDRDGDGLPANIEAEIGTSDNNHDSDGCGEGDGSEYIAGRDPLSPDCNAADDNQVDTDGDGLVDVEEDYLGTDPTKADSDGDLAPDPDELFHMGTDPWNPDTDGDGWIDGHEDIDFDGNLDANEDSDRDGHFDRTEDSDGDDFFNTGESDALDATSIPARQLARGSSWEPNHTHTFLDSEGRLHYASEERDDEDYLLYGMLLADGTEGISMSRVWTVGVETRKPQIFVKDGEVRIFFTARPTDGGDAGIVGIVSFDINGHSLDGSGMGDEWTIVPTLVPVPGSVTHWSVSFEGRGTANVFYDDHGRSHGEDSGTTSTVRYARISGSGHVVRTAVLAHYDRLTAKQDDTGNDVYGQHRVHDARSVTLQDGTIHVAWMATTAPGDQTWDYEVYPTGTYYARIDAGGRVHGPYFVSHARFERLDLAAHPAHPELLYLATTTKDSDDDGYYEYAGVRFGIIDLAQVSIIPRVGDAFGVTEALAPESFMTPLTTVWADGDGHHKSSLVVLENGMAVYAFSDGDADTSVNVMAIRPNGTVVEVLEDLRFQDSEDYGRNRRTPVFPWQGGIGLMAADWDGGDLRLGTIKPKQLPVDDVSAINRAPRITSSPGADELSPGQVFEYQGVAEDDVTDASALRWGIVAGPAGMSQDASGLLTWVPTAANAGDWLVTVRACDDDAESRQCGHQSFVLTVVLGRDNSPHIVSVPADTAFVGHAYAYLVEVQDAELPNDSFTYAIRVGATGNMAIDATGLLTWTPAAEEEGVLPVQLSVTDRSGRMASQTFQVVVSSTATATVPQIAEEGCGCASSGPADWALLTLGTAFLVGLRRRRRA